MLRILLQTVICGLIIAAMVMIGSNAGWFPRPSFYGTIVIFFVLSNLALHWFANRTMNKAPDGFVRIYLLATVLRMLFFGAFIYMIVWLDRPEARKNTTFFLMSYFLFTALEVTVLFRQINAQKRSQKGQKRL